MTTFDEREKAFEAKFAHDADMQFRAEVRRNRLLGLWAAGLLGKSGDAATAYAAEIGKSDMTRPGYEDVIRRLVADLDTKADEATIRAKFAELTPVAKAQLLNEA